eukprot:Skav207973  [mRNA]  locus=scaffold495:54437:55063:+ [translate_table: standard]
MIYPEEKFDLSVPPGGALIILQSPDTANPKKPQLTETTKPECLAMLGDARWSEFVEQLSSTLQQWWTSSRPISISVAAICGIAALVLGLSAVLGWLDFWPVAIAIAVLLGVAVAAAWGGGSFVHGRNLAVDKRIHQLCEELTSAVGGAVAVQYHKASPVERRGIRSVVRVYRYIVFSLPVSECELPTVMGAARDADESPAPPVTNVQT